MAENVITSYDSGETVGEILQSSQFAREIVAPVACKTNKTTIEDPKTPLTQLRKQRPNSENTKSKRKKEKQDKLQSIRSQATSPSLRRARSRINFKVVSPPKKPLLHPFVPFYRF